MKEPSRKDWFRSYVGQTAPSDRRTGGLGRTAFNSNAQAPVPKRAGVPITQSFTDKYALQKELAIWATSGLPAAARPIFATIYTPSDRLILTIQVFFEPNALVNIDPTFTNVPTWHLTRQAINSISGRESTMSQLYPLPAGNASLPDEVILPDAPELIRATINLNEDQFTAPFGASGVKAYLQAKWEPDVQTIPRDELQRLYDRCKIALGNPPTFGSS